MDNMNLKDYNVIEIQIPFCIAKKKGKVFIYNPQKSKKVMNEMSKNIEKIIKSEIRKNPDSGEISESNIEYLKNELSRIYGRDFVFYYRK